MKTFKPARSNIFDLLDSIQTKNPAYYRSLPEDHQSSFSPLVVMKWLAAVSNDDQLLTLNEFVNTKLFALSHTDKTLMMDLMTTCTTGRKSRYKWIKRPTNTSNAIDNLFIQYYGAQVDLDEAHATHTEEDIVNICYSLGMQDSEVKKLLKL